MKNLISAIALLLLSLPCSAQHVELGAFMNYDHQDFIPAQENLFGLGARADFNISKYVQWEVEMAYDFKYPSFSTAQTATGLVLHRGELGLLHANTGLKVQTAGGHFFGFVKGGANRYDLETRDQALPSLVRTDAQRSIVKGVLYPGLGAGFYAGPVGIRLDAGDEIIWIDGGTKHSLRITFGPTFRF